MKKRVAVFMLLSFAFSAFVYCQVQQPGIIVQPETKTADVNKDGSPDVTYYRDGDYVSKVEADTNYDGKVDTVVTLKNGKFDSAQTDSDYNGDFDKKFSNADDFRDYINKSNPEFESNLSRPDWQWDLLKF